MVVALLASCLLSLPPSHAMPPFRAATANLPPLAMDPSAGNPGALTEVVEELARRVSAPLHAEQLPWKRAMLLSEHQPRLAVFPLTRSVEREAKFRWLVRLFQENTMFVSAAGRDDIDLQHPAALKRCSVVVVRGSANLAQLRTDGFTRLVEVTDVQGAVKMVHDGIVDLLYGSETIFRDLPATMGYAADQFKYGPPAHAVDIWLGGSLDFSAAEAAEFQDAMRSMHKDGSYARILKKYKLSLPSPAPGAGK
jgi:polar amino acid transport system substrate-binding protein